MVTTGNCQQELLRQLSDEVGSLHLSGLLCDVSVEILVPPRQLRLLGWRLQGALTGLEGEAGRDGVFSEQRNRRSSEVVAVSQTYRE